ncbi:MAG: hypothetical protein AB1589_15875 [Cyanobacteriota bacterium]
MLIINLKRLMLTLVCLVTGLGIVSVLKLETTAQTLTHSMIQRAKLEVSQLTGTPANQLTIAAETTLTDTGITRFKLRDSQGNIYGISLDAAGNPVPPETLAQIIQAIENRGSNRLDVERIYLSRVGTLRTNVSRVVEQANPLKSRESTGVAQVAGVVEPNRIDTYPPQLLKVFPLEESAQSYVQSIGANLNFKLGEGGDLGSLHLFVDGVDVTPQARIANTRDWPSSHVEISYTPNFSEPATHCAEVRFQTLEGKTISHHWCFSIKPPSL